MKYILFFAIVLLRLCDVYSQNWVWGKGFIGQGAAYSVCTDGAGNVFTTGNFQTNITLGTFTLTNIGGFQNMFIAKHDSSGNVLWAKNYGGNFLTEVHSACVDIFGNVIVTGWYGCTSINFGSFTLTNAGPLGSNYDMFIVKYDSNGNVLWARNAGGPNSGCITEGNSIASDLSGNIMVTGDFSWTATFGSTTVTNSGGGDVFTAKYDLNGNFLWVRQSTGTGNSANQGYGICSDGGGNIFVTGAFEDSFVSFGSSTLTNGSFVNIGDIFIVKYSANGNMLWARRAGGPNWDEAVSIITDGSGNPYITGHTQSNTVQFGSTVFNQPGSNAMFVAKYDTNGNMIWVKLTGSGPANSSGGRSIASDGGSNIYVTGSFYWQYVTIGPIMLYSPGWDAIYITKFDTSGNVLCAAALENGGNPGRSAVATDQFGNAYMSGGYSYNPFIIGNDTLPTTNSHYVFLAKYSCNNFPGNVSPTNAQCYGQCDGAATAIPLGGTSPYTYNWSNGQTMQTATALCPGTYSVIISDVNSNHTATYFVSITQPTAMTVTTTATNYCPGNLGSAQAGSSGGNPPYTYFWNNGQTTPAITGLVAGTYTVIVNDASGCTNTTTVSVIALSKPTPSIIGNTTICSGTNTTLSASGGTSYLWSTGASGNTIIVSPSVNTTYSVSISNGFCSADTSIFIVANPLPNGIVSGNTTICSGQNTTLTASGGTLYSWNTGATNSSISISPTGTTSYTVFVTDMNGCNNTASASVIVNQLPIPVMTGATICTGNIATLTASGGTHYLWNTGSTTSAISTSPSVNTSYTVTITDPQGCTNTGSIIVTVNPLPIPAISGNNVICSGNTATLTASGGISYSWNNNATTQSILISPTSSTSYTVVVTDNNGCMANVSTSIIVNPSPIAAISGNLNIFLGESTTLTASGGITYLWDNGETNTAIIVSPIVSGIFCVTTFGINNCSDTTCITLLVKSPCDTSGTFFFPNAFSPNGDDENDVLKIYYRNKSCIKSLHLLIYEYWGRKVFETTDPYFVWDGNYQDKPLATSVLTYYLVVQFTDETRMSKKGNISLIR